MNRKAQGLSLNIIIVAAVGLLVLVILSVIFIGKMGGTSRDIDNCQTKGGDCVDTLTDCTSQPPDGKGGRQAPTSWKCIEGDTVTGKLCCITI